MTPHPHQGLILQCKEGDRKAQYELYKRYAKAMLNVAHRITNSVEEAEDVLQDAFVRAFTKLDTYKGDATFGAWLKRIVVNTAINHLRSKKLDTIALEEGMDPVEEMRMPVMECGEASWKMAQIREAISSLPDGYRVVFSLYVIEGYDHGEISLILNISEATSKSQFSRARKKLRQILEDQYYV
ncbi:MAG: RNA polymerase sigma factor [Bacteroidia bacterium]